MFKDNALLAQLKQDIQETLPKVEGKVKATDKSYGFLEVDKNTSYFIAPPNMKKVMHGDIITATITSEKNKDQAVPATLVTPALTTFIAKIMKQHNKFVLKPPAPYKGGALPSQLATSGKYEEGDYVFASLVNHPLAQTTKDNNKPAAKVESLIAKHNDNNAPWLVTLAKYKLQGLDLASKAPEQSQPWVLNDAGCRREDLTDSLFFTIDGQSTQDMDDAVSIERLANDHWKLRVAVADPSAYVSVNDEVDAQARSRGFTHYLPGQHITMLPEELSHDLCSLRENQQRPALVCTMEITNRGKLLNNAKFCLAMISSKAKLSYPQVTAFLAGDSEWQPATDMAQALHALNAMAFARSVWRAKNTQLFDSQPDYRIILSEDKKIENVVVEHQDVARNMIEEAMLCANFSAGELLAKHQSTGVFNTHPGFEPDKAVKLSKLLQEHGYVYHPQHLLTPQGFCQLQRELTSRNDNYFAARLRKFQLYANISQTPQPHHGLGTQQYATWTSPIRKYGDLQNHRLIKSILHPEFTAPVIDVADVELLKEQRDNQRMVERDVSNWLYLDYLAQDLINLSQLTAKVFNINRGGLMAKIENNGAVVFIPLNNLTTDRKASKIDTELGTISLNEQVIYRLNDTITLVLTELNREKLSITGKVI